MFDGPAHRRFRTIAQKWRDLAEQRRDHYAELYRSGRWKIYYTEQDFVRRMREVADTVDLWAGLAPRGAEAPCGAEAPAAQSSSAADANRRNAA
jgi:uncharacterized repeat protein (TIGR03809 family)